MSVRTVGSAAATTGAAARTAVSFAASLSLSEAVDVSTEPSYYKNNPDVIPANDFDVAWLSLFPPSLHDTRLIELVNASPRIAIETSDLFIFVIE